MGDRPIPDDPARGALVVVYRRRGDALEYLLLRRTGALDGDWAWGPPAGEREAGEDAETCARRELREETRLGATVVLTDAGSAAWPVYLAEVGPGTDDAAICLSSEHDLCLWPPLVEAAARTAPDVVRAGLVGAAALLGDR